MNALDAALYLSFAPLALAGLNLLTWRRLKPASVASAGRQAASCLIPARNEERAIRDAVRSALRSDAVLEVLVCDDGSSDATAQIVEEESLRDPRVRLIRGAPLPQGWVGKPHACHQLAHAARGEFLLFMDADVRLLPGGVEALVAESGGAAERRVVTAVPQQRMETLSEKLVLPYLVLTYLCWLPLFLVGRGRDPRTVAACGQLLGMRRSTHDALGGFEAIRSAIVDDVELCRRAKRLGMTVCFRDGSVIARCRMYDGFSSVWRGFSKNIFEGLGRRPDALVLAVGLYLTTFVLPYFVLPLASGRTFSLAMLSVGANWLLRALTWVRFRQSALGALLHPLGALMVILIALNSARWSWTKQIEWAGRKYSERES